MWERLRTNRERGTGDLGGFGKSLKGLEGARTKADHAWMVKEPGTRGDHGNRLPIGLKKRKAFHRPG